MSLYKNLSGKSGIEEYEVGIDYIIVKFKKSGHYLYSTNIIGQSALSMMHSLATAGRGLATFIAKNPDINQNYSSKW